MSITPALLALQLIRRRQEDQERSQAESDRIANVMRQVLAEPPDVPLDEARAQWAGRLLVCRDYNDPWWGGRHRHKISRISRSTRSDDLIVSMQCVDCPQHGALTLDRLAGWDEWAP